jgi:hypothetical protein
MITSGCDLEGPAARRRRARAGRRGRRSLISPLSDALDRRSDPFGPAQFVASSRSKARETKMVSSTSPSVVVKICASTMLPPAAAQAPVTMASRRGWSGASTVSSVTPRNWSVSTRVAVVRPAMLRLAQEASRAAPAARGSTLSQ